MKHKAKHTAILGLMVALAFTLSYLESLLPINLGIPGVKLGLANLVVVIVLYTLKPGEAFAIAMVRILLAAATFGNPYSLAYSLCGGLLSFTVMLLMKKTNLSVIGVSILGGVSHNLGQILIAAVLMGTTKIVYYFPVLLVAGLITGFLLGGISHIILLRLNTIDLNKGE